VTLGLDGRGSLLTLEELNISFEGPLSEDDRG
jgi:hypothetical protein